VSSDVVIRAAGADDVEFAFAMIVALATYERAPDSVVGTPELLHEALFGKQPTAEAVIAERDGERIGWALFHSTFSTWECRPGIWLEDLFVLPEDRRGGAGEALLRHLAQIAVQRGCTRLEWVALDWNEPALSFYRKHGATVMAEWLQHRMDGAVLEEFAAGPDG
jgi:GNAT superfamily N-acetyltransferase